MPRQFVYQDAHGILYPAHNALAFQPGLVPGWYDTETRAFTPIGNPQEQVGNIVTDAGVGVGTEKVLSGLREDVGAGMAPLDGVAFTAPQESGEADLAARLMETEVALATERERVVALEAQVAMLNANAEPTRSLSEGVTETAASAPDTDSPMEPARPNETKPPAPAHSKRRVRKARP